MTTLFALFAELERDLISERTREGLAKARSSGRKLGRPKGLLGVSRLNGKEDDIRRFLERDLSKTAIAKLTGVSRTTLYSFMRTRGLKPSPYVYFNVRREKAPFLSGCEPRPATVASAGSSRSGTVKLTDFLEVPLIDMPAKSLIICPG